MDDLFRLYTGVGDTAVATADFDLRDLIPERVLYRSEVPLPGSERREDGWQYRHDAVTVRMGAELVPDAVAREVRRTYERRPMPSDMTRWLLRKAGLPEPQPAF